MILIKLLQISDFVIGTVISFQLISFCWPLRGWDIIWSQKWLILWRASHHLQSTKMYKKQWWIFSQLFTAVDFPKYLTNFLAYRWHMQLLSGRELSSTHIVPVVWLIIYKNIRSFLIKTWVYENPPKMLFLRLLSILIFSTFY